jgi:hypothetical protein
MTTFTARRWRNIFLLVLGSALMLVLAGTDRANLGQTNFFTGWTLIALMLILALYNLRKRLPVLRLARSATWLQLHAYLGLFCALIFLVHVDFALPNGYLEASLTLLFALVSVSGVLGLWLSRSLPARLTRRGENVLFERIPAFRTHLREEVEELVEQAAREQGSATLPELYTRHLRPFLSGPRNLWGHLFESRRPYHRLAGRMAAMERYLNRDEQAILADIAERVRLKDDLDYQFAGQGLLKAWLFVHIPLNYALLLLVAAHILVVYAFMGGA